MCPESSRRLRSFQAGSVLWKTPGVPSEEYQPMPNPSPFVGSAPIRDLRLWSISEYWPWYRTLSILIGLP